ncbi:hypothetical protein BGZ91_010227 [Linnemannia elongata]|nr:hypothetical protein BGZ91_010227 [Linnemannia elongata]
MDINPLAIPEILLRIGLYIQVWFPIPSDSTIYDTTKYDFQPYDLLAAIAVNRLFRGTLEPLLWTVYNEGCFHPKGLLSKPASRLVTLNNSCQYIRYLELLHLEEPWHLFQQPDLFPFKNCTQLRELKLSYYVNLGWAVQLIEANPNLTLLDWTYPDEVDVGHHRSESYHSKELDFSKNLLCVVGLRKLRSLRLEAWSLEILHLYHVLDMLSDSLEELYLAKTNTLEVNWIVDTETTTLDKSSLAAMSEEEVAEALELIPKRPLLLPKLKTLHLDLDWNLSDHKSIYDMMRAFPELGTLIIHPNAMLDFVKLQPILRKFCPNLGSIQYIPHRWSEVGSRPFDNDTLITVFESLSPGNLVDFRMGLDEDELDDDVMAALLEHRSGLETLELGFSGFEYKPFENVAEILRQCKKLKRVSFYSSSRTWSVEDVKDLFTVLHEPGACKGLESLEMRGFDASSDEFGVDDGAEGGYDVHNPDGDPAAQIMSRGYLPKPWRYLTRDENKIQLDKPGRSFVHPHIRFMVFAALKEMPLMKRVILNNEHYETCSF